MSRRVVWAIAGAGIAAAMAGGAVSQAINPASSSQSLSSETSSAAPSRAAAASSTADDSPSSTSPASTSSAASTSAAAELPAAPVMAMTCPGAGTGAAPAFGHRITATAPYTVAISYGDGDRYSDDDQHLKAIFGHKYLTPGTFTVTALLKDATGQTARATCAYSWTAPVHVSVPAPHSSTTGSGGGDSYVNVDGNTIHSPVTAPVAPQGATAHCNDGTWSFSQNHRGTCSGHHGVAEWL